MNCAADKCRQGRSEKPCDRAICTAALHRIPADEPAISPAEAMGWSVAVWAAVAGIAALAALMGLPLVVRIFQS